MKKYSPLPRSLFSLCAAAALAATGAAQEVTPYGCVNPAGSLTVLSGEPSIAKSVEFGLNNPFCTQGDPTFTFLMVDIAPAAGFPCGLLVPGWGMEGSGADGELLLNLVNPVDVISGPLWSCAGGPVSIDVNIPPLIGLVGATFYAQGLFVDIAPGAEVPIGLTDGLEIVVGPTPAPLQFGDSIASSISPATEVEVYEFEALAGDHLIIPFTRTSASGFTLEVCVSLPNGAPLSCESATTGTLEFDAPETGTYLLSVRNPAKNVSGSYHLTLQRTVAPGNVTPTSFGDTHSAGISPRTDIDVYQFSCAAQEQLFIPFTRTSASGFTLALDLRDELGQVVASDGGTVGIFEHEIATAGEYFLWVYDPNLDVTGSYQLTFQKTTDPANPSPMAFGASLATSLAARTEIDVYEFTGVAGDDLYVPFVRTSAGGFSLQLNLYDEDGELLAQASGTGGVFEFELPASGQYYLWVFNPGLDVSGSYHLTLERTNNPGNVIDMDPATLYPGTISPRTEVDIYRYSAPGAYACTSYARTSAAGFSLEVTLRDAAGAVLDMHAATEGSLATELPGAGDYFLWVRNPEMDVTGTYQIQTDLSLFPCP